MTGYDVRGTVEAGFDAAKMLTRIDYDDPATVATLEACADAVTELNRAQTIAMVEPFISRRVDGQGRQRPLARGRGASRSTSPRGSGRAAPTRG